MNENDRTTMFVMSLAFLLVAVVIVVLNDLVKRRLVRKAIHSKVKPPARFRNNRTSWTLVLVLVVGSPLLLYVKFFTNWIPALPQHVDFVTFVAIWGTVFGVVVALIAARVLFVRWRYRRIQEAFRAAQTGDPAAAIAMLREKLQSDGRSPDILHAIALIYCQMQDWKSALQAIVDAEECTGAKRDLIATKGLVLWKLGRLAEAAELLQAAQRLLPRELAVACNYGSVLSEMGEGDKAAAVLEQAEEIYRKSYIIGREARRMHHEALDALRQKVAAARDELRGQ